MNMILDIVKQVCVFEAGEEVFLLAVFDVLTFLLQLKNLLMDRGHLVEILQ